MILMRLKKTGGSAEKLLQRRIPAGAIEVPCKNDLQPGDRLQAQWWKEEKGPHHKNGKQ